MSHHKKWEKHSHFLFTWLYENNFRCVPGLRWAGERQTSGPTEIWSKKVWKLLNFPECSLDESEKWNKSVLKLSVISIGQKIMSRYRSLCGTRTRDMILGLCGFILWPKMRYRGAVQWKRKNLSFWNPLCGYKPHDFHSSIGFTINVHAALFHRLEEYCDRGFHSSKSSEFIESFFQKQIKVFPVFFFFPTDIYCTLWPSKVYGHSFIYWYLFTFFHKRRTCEKCARCSFPQT